MGVSSFSYVQTIVSSQGTSYESGNVHLIFSVGEPLIETYSNNDNVVTQGFHQPEKDNTSSVKNTETDFGLIAYPNPVSEAIYLSAEDGQFTAVEIYNAIGVKCYEQTFSPTHFLPIDFSGYAGGIYILRVKSVNNGVQTIEMIKK